MDVKCCFSDHNLAGCPRDTAGQRRVPKVEKILVLIDREEQITHRPSFDVIILQNYAHLIFVRPHYRQ